MNNLKKIITYLLISLFSISLIPNNVFALDLKNKNSNEKEEIEYFNDGTLNLGEKEFKILNAVENILDEIIASGSDSINEYFKEKGINQIKASDKFRKKEELLDVYLQ
ncbi:hypothetical protein SCB17_003031 [Clostridium perfringens]|nr:hypothetical protein [Clostridium perfringens]